MAAHVPLSSFLGFGEVLCNVFYIDEWPREIISFANSLEPGGFCWEARSAMEVPNSGFNAGEFVYVVEVGTPGGNSCTFGVLHVCGRSGLFRRCTWS